MTVLRSRQIPPIPSPKTTPKSRKTTQNDTMGDNLEPCTPSQAKESDPDPRPGPTTRRSLRLAHLAEPPSCGEDGSGSGSVGARVWSGEGFVEEEESGGVWVLSLRSGRRVAKRVDGGELGEGSERASAGDGYGDGSPAAGESGKGKGKRKMGSGSEEDGGAGVGGGRRRFSREEMGKAKLGEEGSGFGGNGGGEDGDGGGEGLDLRLRLGLGLGSEGKAWDGNFLRNSAAEAEASAADEEREERQRRDEEERRRQRREDYRRLARQSVNSFAHGNGEASNAEEVDEEPDVGDWPGPFSTAWKIIRDREKRHSQAFSSGGKPEDLEWVPEKSGGRAKVVAPSLLELALKGLVNNVDNLPSLYLVPDSLRNWMSKLLSDSRKMNGGFFRSLLEGTPTAVCVSDCSWLSEEELLESMKEFDASILQVLQLDLCGRCLPDYILRATIAQSPNCLPALHTISLSGACRLSDDGINFLVSSAPALTSLNLSQCSLITYSSIDSIAESLGSILRKLYLDDCQGIDVMHTMPALQKFERLEVLSVVRVESVCDEFIMEFVSICGHNMKELILTDCIKLTDSSVKVIAEKCPGLCTIDLSKCKLTDSALGYLANGCQLIQRLTLSRSPFSDKSIAAFVETSGERLIELSLNNVKKVGCQTALSIAKRAINLKSLDLSWCRDLTDNAMGLIVDNCPALQVLKLFGCSQITEFFLNSHSNSLVKIIGLKMSPVLEDVWQPNL